jgi:hypothetical protein
MKAKNFVVLLETIIGTQLALTGIIFAVFYQPVPALICLITGVFYFLGGGQKLVDLKYGKGKWEDVEL